MTPIRYAITIFSGFLQRLGSPGSGFVGLQRDIELLTTHRNDVRVGLYPWKANASDVAESLWRYRPRENGHDPKQIHVVVGYSYGGDRAVKFVRELESRGGTTVRHLLLCDGVRRFDCVPGLAAATGIGALIVPSIVEECIYYVQKNRRWGIRREPFQPAGHRVVAESKGTKLVGPVVKKASHSYIDNDSHFRLTVLGAVDKLLREASGV